MTGLVQRALGDAWDALPPALKAHHRPGHYPPPRCMKRSK